MQDNQFCMMSVACMINNINFGMNFETETDCQMIIIRSEIFKKLLARGSIKIVNEKKLRTFLSSISSHL